MSEFNQYDGNNSSNKGYYDPNVASYYSGNNNASAKKSSSLFHFERNTIDNSKILTQQQYFLAIGLCLVWGLGINFILCKYCSNLFINVNYTVLLVGYFISAIAGSYIYHKSSSPAISFLGYNLVVLPMGIVLSVLLRYYNPTVVQMAFLTTAIIVLAMAVMGFVYPQVFMSISKALISSLILVIIVEVILTFIFRISLGFIDYIVALIFSLYVAYDVARASKMSYTLNNAIDSAADIYMDIINIFIRILSIMARSKD